MAVCGRLWRSWGVVLVIVLDDWRDTIPLEGGRMLPKQGGNGAQSETALRIRGNAGGTNRCDEVKWRLRIAGEEGEDTLDFISYPRFLCHPRSKVSRERLLQDALAE